MLPPTTCVLIPQETEGPYPLDLSKNAAMFRQNITEGRPGMPLNLSMTILNVNTCSPIANARVDIWHCDKDGVYSGYNQPGANTVGQTFMRGIQMTDSTGQVKFTTIYPGWYSGRITHIHFQVFVTSVLRATSQVAFPDATNAAVYASSLYVAKGQNRSVASNAADMVFSDGFQNQLLALTANATTGGYDASITVGIQAPTATGIMELEPETGGQFKLEQNFPNPFADRTTLAFTLTNPATVQLEVFDLAGRKIADIARQQMSAGKHEFPVSRAALGGASGNYIYQLTTESSYGIFRQAKVMTLHEQ
jgi:protocatechuate 3,4-dioxygenase beta subunit